MQTRLIPFSQQQPGTWRGGEVHEIFRDPPDADYPAGDYNLWVGTATIERAAVYSYFARAERLHIPLTGQGLRLDFDDPVESVFLTTQKACTFSGTRPLHATPVDGPVLAFNLIYRQGQTSGFRFIPAAELPFSHAVDVAAGERLSLIVYGTSGGTSGGT
ncbi:MAG: HutD family protein, partial [Caldilineaceae bacterium]